MAMKLAAAGYKETTSREPKSGEPPPAAAGTSAVYGRFAYFLGPHHIHFINKPYVEMQQWYMKAFDATLRPGQTDFFIGADLPGVGYSLNCRALSREDRTGINRFIAAAVAEKPPRSRDEIPA
jgi:hypothetical protein